MKAGLMSRTFAVAKASLAHERARKNAPRRRRQEIEFLPALLEVIESPPSPVGRALFWTLVGMLFVAIGWACVASMDVVAVAQGKVVTTGRSKVIQPSEVSVIRAIRVADGQKVKAGEVLIELDPTNAIADRDRIKADLMITQVEVARLNAALDEKTAEAAFVPPADADKSTVRTQRALLISQVSEQRAKLASLDDEIARKRADLGATDANIVKLERTLPLVRERADARMQLSGKGFFPRLTALEQEQTAIEQEQDLIASRHRRTEIVANIASLERQREQTVAEYKKNIFLRLAELDRQVAASQQDLLKAEQRSQLQTLVAPIDGVIQQLAVYTVGGVVTPAQQLLVIAPEDDPLEVEAMVLNRDVGFVEPGQEVTIKFETFLFTKYGTIDGQVSSISHDAVTDDKLGLTYPARVTLARQTIDINRKPTALGAGMSVTAEIKTDTRLMIEYILSPLLKYQQETMRER